MNKQKLVLPISILLGCIILGGFYYVVQLNKQSFAEKNSSVTASEVKIEDKIVAPDINWREASEPYSDSMVCMLKISAVTNFEEGKMKGNLNIDDEATRIVFTDIDSDVPSMIGNLGDKSPLIKITNGSTVYLIEKTASGNINVFTLFRGKNIITMSKQYDLFGMPFGLMMIGDCLSGV